MIDQNLLESYKVQCGPEILDELQFCFMSEVPQKMECAFDNLNKGDLENLKGTLHALKNSFMNVGAAIEGNYCQALEDQVDDLAKKDLQEGLKKIESFLCSVQKELNLALSIITDFTGEDES